MNLKISFFVIASAFLVEKTSAAHIDYEFSDQLAIPAAACILDMISNDGSTDSGIWQISHCGGTLIASDKILTSAHCIPRNGNVTVKCNNGTEFGKMNYAVIHGGFASVEDEALRSSNDLALVELIEPMKTVPARLPASRREAKSLMKKGKCLIVGTEAKDLFVATATRRFRAGLLNEKDLFKEFATIKSDQAKEFVNFNRSGIYSWLIAEQNMLREGDSGGGIVCMNEKSEWTLIGVRSFRVGFFSIPNTQKLKWADGTETTAGSLEIGAALNLVPKLSWIAELVEKRPK